MIRRLKSAMQYILRQIIARRWKGVTQCGLLLLLLLSIGIFIQSSQRIKLPKWPLTENIYTATTRNQIQRVEPKLILFWTKLFRNTAYKQDIMQTAGIYNCRYTSDRKRYTEAAAVIFHSIDLNIDDMPWPRLFHQRWIFFHHESPARYMGFTVTDNWPLWNSVRFNWTMSYEEGSDVFLPYGKSRFLKKYTVDKTWKPPNFTDRKDALWIVSNCEPPGKRKRLVDGLIAANISVDIYGHCAQGRIPTAVKPFFEQYKFYLAFENSICKDYVTEKFWKIVETGAEVIPVTYNGANMSRYLIPEYKYINAFDFKGPRTLAAHLKSLTNDMLSEYFNWKQIYDVFHDLDCPLCAKLNTIDYARRYDVGNLKDRVFTDKCLNHSDEYFKH